MCVALLKEVALDIQIVEAARNLCLDHTHTRARAAVSRLKDLGNDGF